MSKWMDWTAMALSFVGGIAWGIYGITGLFMTRYNIVETIFGFGSIFSNIIYTLVGISAIYLLFYKKK